MPPSSHRIRVLIGKPGLDGHERGAWVVAYGLRDAGFEVIYTGLRQTPEQLAQTAVAEDVDILGLSILSGAHVSLTRRVLSALESQAASGLHVLVGGAIPESDIPVLESMGVAGVFPTGSTVPQVVDFIRTHVAPSTGQAALAGGHHG